MTTFLPTPTLAGLEIPPAPPTITGTMLEALLRHPAGVLVQTVDGRVFPLPRLTDDQADDPDLVVLLTAEEGAGYLDEVGGKAYGKAARDVTLDLFVQHARGLL
jgi:hypothetical protein